MAAAEMLDLIIVLKPEAAEQMDASVLSLKAVGLTVSSIDAENGVVEGTLAAEKLGEVRKLSSVAYARVNIDYVCEPPCEAPGQDEPGHNSED